jgi:AraC-like DNA-binding protein
MTSTVEKQVACPLTVEALGVRWPHDPGFAVERPHGLGMYLLVHFHSPTVALTLSGVVSAEPGDCLLYDPSFPQWYRGRDGEYVDDWLHVHGSGMPELVRRYQIPVNVIMRPRDAEFLTPILEAINREMRRQEPLWGESVRVLVESLFLQLRRQLSPAGATPAEEAQVAELRNLRMQVHERMQEPWSVAAMARLVNLSRSHFANRYTKLLGISPMEDLIHARLRRARALLTNAGMSVADAAEQSGFGSVCHFSRLFRKHVGCAPRDYRRFPLASEVDMSDTESGESRPSLLLERSSVTEGWELLTGKDLPTHPRAAQEASGNRSRPTPTWLGNDTSRKWNRRSPVKHR